MSCTRVARIDGHSLTQLSLLPMRETVAEHGRYSIYPAPLLSPNQLPAHASYQDGTRTSWGASVMHSPEDGLYHMFVAEMKGALFKHGKMWTGRQNLSSCDSPLHLRQLHIDIVDSVVANCPCDLNESRGPLQVQTGVLAYSGNIILAKGIRSIAGTF